jgi:ribose 5-phosphate isomerase A
MPDYEKEKELAALESLKYIQEGMKVGLGSGSTAAYFVRLLGEKVRNGLKIEGIPTSVRTSVLAREHGIPLTDFGQSARLDVSVDGADEFDPSLNLIKGGGGALLREKIVATATDFFIITADSRKPVSVLGAFPLPVEVIPFGWELAAKQIRDLGADVKLRMTATSQPFLTAQKNHILDCKFEEIQNPKGLSDSLRQITGVVEHGLFVGLTDLVIVGRGDTTETLSAKGAS